MSQSPYRKRTLGSPYHRGTISFCWIPGSWLTREVKMFDLSASSCPTATLSLIRSLGLALSKHSSKDSREHEASPKHQPLEQWWRVFEEQHKPSTKALWRVTHWVPTSNLVSWIMYAAIPCLHWHLTIKSSVYANAIFKLQGYLFAESLRFWKDDSLSPLESFNIIYELQKTCF